MKINEFTPDTGVFKNIKNESSGINSENDSNNNSTISGESALDFGNILKDKLDEVNDYQVKANNAEQDFVEGGNTDVHTVMLDAEDAKLSLALAVQVRNKLVDAYQELNRTQM